MTEADGSEDVNDFLKRIRELGDQRDREDEERTRKLEQEILQGRKQREARRAERARSLSPSKSNAGTPHSTDTSMQDPSISPGNLPQLSFPSQQRVHRGSQSPEDMSSSPSRQDTTPENTLSLSKPSMASHSSPNAAMAPTRSNTMSWQQRPLSRGTTVTKTRPLSMVASENNVARSSGSSIEPSSGKDTAISRNEIMRSLGAKEPIYFTQTEERGHGSAAFRRNQVDVAPASSPVTGAMRLPGMSREPSAEPGTRSSPPGSVRSTSPSIEGSIRGGLGSVHKYSSSASLSSPGGIRSPLPTMSSQRFDLPSSDTNTSQSGESNHNVRAPAMSPSQGRISLERIERPVSPTKGLGGFVQSAMLKRSDSVNKRWSTQAGPGLSRGNSIASSRSGFDGTLAAVGGMGPPRDVRGSLSREASPITGSRPGSSHSNLTITQAPEAEIDKERPPTAGSANALTFDRPNDTLGKTAPPLQREVNSFSELQGVKEEETHSEEDPPASPSKRWSPTKSSWLENAINKSESPKPKAAPPQQPSWMSELNKAKQQRGSVDLGKPRDFKEVTTASLMRSPPMGGLIKSQSLGGLSSELGAGISMPKAKNPSSSPSSRPQISVHEAEASKTLATEAEPVTFTEPLTQEFRPLEKTPMQHEPATTEDLSSSQSPPAKLSPDKPNGRRSPLVKAKPETPPKKDFTSSLRPRKMSGAKETKDEPEFRNVFGKLKRTQTQNYKAPDELKDNIMRGKAGLNVTGGPKQTELKDEFKDSILRKKEGMRLPSASTTIRSASSSSVSKGQDVPLPEALAKRQDLARSGSSLNNITTIKKPTERSAVSGIQSSEVESGPRDSKKTLGEPTRTQKEPTMDVRLGGNFNAALAGLISRGPSPMAKSNGTGPTRAPDMDSSKPSPQLDNIHSSSESGAKLSHMTKGRARGPKRRLPTIADTKSGPIVSPEKPQFEKAGAPSVTKGPDILTKVRDREPTSKGSETRPLGQISNNHRRISQPTSPRKPSTHLNLPDNAKLQSPKPASKDIEAPRTSPQIKQKPTTTPETPKPRKPSTSTAQSLQARSLDSPDLQKPSQAASISPIRQSDPVSSNSDPPKPSVKDATVAWQEPSSTQRNGVRSPIKLLTRKDEVVAQEQAGLELAMSQVPVGLGIQTASGKPRVPSPFTYNLPASPAASPAASPRSPKSPPLPAKKPASIASRVPSKNLTPQPPPWKSKTSLSPNSEASRVLTDFFGGSPVCNTKFGIDTQSIISSRSSHDGSGKIKTLRKQIFEVAVDGKLLPVPSAQEHILFEANLYLCTHVFGSATGTRTTEVYLWCGDAVPTSAVEDAQLFCRKVARENSGKLTILKQGKETANFFQALGGIVIIRRGSSAKAGSSSSSVGRYMLCGRRHVGQIAFDEVNLTPSSLCKGFPYIVSGPSGKLYLWKGSGSGADELGCAKLIGMDISLTGEIEEIEDGHEPASFWEAFPDGKQGLPDSDVTRYWPLKASCDKYTNRLFKVEVEAPRPKSSSSFLWGRRGSAPTSEDDGAMTAMINEINPFAQSDLDNEGIHVLDAFFEVHVLVPSNPRFLLHTFRAACAFAQEYGILVASAEDRPFVPVSRVVLGRSVPEGVKRAFRKWVDTPYERMECVVLPLNESLRATQPA